MPLDEDGKTLNPELNAVLSNFDQNHSLYLRLWIPFLSEFYVGLKSKGVDPYAATELTKDYFKFMRGQ